ncbi:MAG: C10 family peptidase [Bacteroidales bacterium]|nr:C10 family peptidase [Bacteroidales bacterium]
MKIELCSGLVVLLSVFFLSNCNKDTYSSHEDVEKQDLSEKSVEKLPYDLQTLSIDDARTVAKLFVDGELPTKSEIQKTIKSVIPVYGEDEDVLMYAVNYSDGFILVSATTNYYPILAVVDHGEFSILPNSGQELIVDEIKDAIAYSKDRPIKDAKKVWRHYMDSPSLEMSATKVGIEYYILLDDYLMDWYDDGRTVYVLRDQPDNMPDDMYEYFCESASLDMPCDYPYMDYAIITEKHYSVESTLGPYLQTKWDQSGNGDGTGIAYNSAVPGNLYLGCVTVAVGQIMRYFEYPSSAYNWSAMPNTTSNTVLSSFLATLRTELNVDIGGGSTYHNAKNTLQNYGYSVVVENHSSTDVYTSLSNNRPVYMRGESNIEGHAWVCDGFYNSYGYDEYKLYILRIFNGQLHDFAEWESDRVYEFGPTMFHMNWGWGGYQDGYYVDSSVQGYSGIRKDLLISTQ